MESNYKFFIGVAVAVLLLLGVFFAYKNLELINGKVINGANNIPSFVECLNKKNITMYARQDDLNFKAQMSLFENYSSQLQVIDCDLNIESCNGIIIYPTWKINGVLVHGSLSLNVLAKFSGCSLN